MLAVNTLATPRLLAPVCCSSQHTRTAGRSEERLDGISIRQNEILILRSKRLQPRAVVCEMNIEPRRHPLERSGGGIAPGGSCGAAGDKRADFGFRGQCLLKPRSRLRSGRICRPREGKWSERRECGRIRARGPRHPRQKAPNLSAPSRLHIYRYTLSA